MSQQYMEGTVSIFGKHRDGSIRLMMEFPKKLTPLMEPGMKIKYQFVPTQK